MIQRFQNHSRVPKSFKDAMASPEVALWKEAMDKEMNSLKENGTWEIIKKPGNRKIVQSKWVYAIKYKQDGSILKLKSKTSCEGLYSTKGN
jgi:hypothetical protein